MIAGNGLQLSIKTVKTAKVFLHGRFAVYGIVHMVYDNLYYKHLTISKIHYSWAMYH